MMLINNFKIVIQNKKGVCMKKNYLITLLLAIFLGMFGVHRFYVGKVWTGIIYLLTAGIFGVGYIIDIVLIILGKFTDEKGNEIKN